MVNPGTKYADNQNSTAFNTIPKSPKVSQLIGSVSNPRTGFTIKLMRPRTSPAISATVHEAIVIPGIRCVASTTVADKTNHLIISLIINICV